MTMKELLGGGFKQLPSATRAQVKTGTMTLREIHEFITPLLDQEDMANTPAQLMVKCNDGFVLVTLNDG